MDEADQRHRSTVAALVGATIATVLPGFLTGALAVQISAELGVTEATYGWGLGGFFLAATAGSILLGRLAQRIGPRLQITVVLGVSATMQLAIALFASSFGLIVAALAVCGFVNAGNQTAVNLALTRAQLPRCLLYTSPSPRDQRGSRMPSSA